MQALFVVTMGYLGLRIQRHSSTHPGPKMILCIPMEVHNVNAIIWDLDGTLINSFDLFQQILTDVTPETGHVMPTAACLADHFHGSLDETLRAVLGIKTDEELDIVRESFLKFQVRHYEGDLRSNLFSDAVKLAKTASIKGIRQLILTNRFHEGRGSASPKAIVANTDLHDYIQSVYTGDEVEYRKPDKRSVSPWMSQNNATPEQTLVIGDQYVDAQLAINLGTRAILVNRTGAAIPHVSAHGHDSHSSVQIVTSLNQIELT